MLRVDRVLSNLVAPVASMIFISVVSYVTGFEMLARLFLSMSTLLAAIEAYEVCTRERAAGRQTVQVGGHMPWKAMVLAVAWLIFSFAMYAHFFMGYWPDK